MPVPGRRDVGPEVLKDIEARIELGKERYGTLLQTHNGRDALVDLYEELMDALMYTKQLMMENEDVA